ANSRRYCRPLPLNDPPVAPGRSLLSNDIGFLVVVSYAPLRRRSGVVSQHHQEMIAPRAEPRPRAHTRIPSLCDDIMVWRVAVQLAVVHCLIDRRSVVYVHTV